MKETYARQFDLVEIRLAKLIALGKISVYQSNDSVADVYEFEYGDRPDCIPDCMLILKTTYEKQILWKHG